MDIRNLNNENKKYYEWDELLYDAWEVFEDPGEMTKCEKYFAQIFLETLKIDLDENTLINFTAAPIHFAYLAVYTLRRLKSENSKNFRQNFCVDIEPEI